MSAGVRIGQASWGPVALSWRHDARGRWRCTGISLPPEAAAQGAQGPESPEAAELLALLLTPRRRTTMRLLDLLDEQPDLTAFARRVQRHLALHVAPGSTITYGDLAAAVGRPGAARAVGSVMRRNRFPLLVPCHRVVAAGGRLGGFQDGADGGLTLKCAMLAEEGWTPPRRGPSPPLFRRVAGTRGRRS